AIRLGKRLEARQKQLAQVECRRGRSHTKPCGQGTGDCGGGLALRAGIPPARARTVEGPATPAQWYPHSPRGATANGRYLCSRLLTFQRIFCPVRLNITLAARCSA